MLQALLAASALAVTTLPDQPHRMVQACLYADLTVEGWPVGLSALHRRFPDGRRARHLAQFPTAADEQSGPGGPRLMLVYELGDGEPGALAQVFISDIIIFNQKSPPSMAFEVRVNGATVERIRWPGYEEAAASFRRTGSPRFVATEHWPVWGEAGGELRRSLSREAKRVELRLVGDGGQLFRSSTYDLAAQPLPGGPLGATINEYASRDHEWCFNEPTDE